MMAHSSVRDRNVGGPWLHACRRHPSLLALAVALWLWVAVAPAGEQPADPFSARSYCGASHAAGLVPSRFDELMDIIEATTARHLNRAWLYLDGGPGVVKAIDELGVLVISHTTETHEEIEELIAALRRAGQTDEEVTQLPISLDISRHADQHRQIERILSEPSELDFYDLPLRDVFDLIGEQYSLPITVNWQRIEQDLGITLDTPTTSNYRNVSLRSALRYLLRGFDLAYAIQDELVVITSRKSAQDVLSVRVYLADDLIVRENVEDARVVEQPQRGEVDRLDLTPPEDKIDQVVVLLRWVDEQVQWHLNDVELRLRLDFCDLCQTPTQRLRTAGHVPCKKTLGRPAAIARQITGLSGG